MRKFFIVGTQGIPARYGGLETFAHELATRLAARGWPVWVTCEKTSDQPPGPPSFQGVNLLYVNAPGNNLRTIVGDRRALYRCAELADPKDVVYLLGYGVGPFAWGALRALARKDIEFWLNPDGLEWMRPRWPWHVQQYFRFSERFLGKRSDLVVCDAAAIREHHATTYAIPRERMEVIEYGAPVVDDVADKATESRCLSYLNEYGLSFGEYYAYVGRFVQDNNLELMIRGVLDPRVKRRLLVFASHDPSDVFYQRMSKLIRQSGDREKVVLTGGVYDRELLQALRLGGFAYFHGHEVGGTNPALVEAMGLGSFIIALDTPFNREVLQDAALYFTKRHDDFIEAILRAESMRSDAIEDIRMRAQDRVREYYNWERITNAYESLLRDS